MSSSKHPYGIAWTDRFAPTLQLAEEDTLPAQHDEHDAETDDDDMPPLLRAIGIGALVLVAVCAAIGFGLPWLADKVLP